MRWARVRALHTEHTRLAVPDLVGKLAPPLALLRAQQELDGWFEVQSQRPRVDRVLHFGLPHEQARTINDMLRDFACI